MKTTFISHHNGNGRKLSSICLLFEVSPLHFLNVFKFPEELISRQIWALAQNSLLEKEKLVLVEWGPAVFPTFYRPLSSAGTFYYFFFGKYLQGQQFNNFVDSSFTVRGEVFHDTQELLR